jgi:hypothetical protein
MMIPSQLSGEVRASLARVLRAYGRERLELEFRLGHRGSGGSASSFVPGVCESGWRRLKERLDGSKADDIVVTDTRELISGDNSGGKYVVDQQQQNNKGFWMHKRRLCDTDIDTPAAAWCCRVSMSLEVVDPPERQLPAPAGHRYERHKQRWSYRFACWSVDLTRVASNLPHQLDNDGVSFEVEIELRDTRELFTRDADSLLEYGWTIVCDVCAMMNDDDDFT